MATSPEANSNGPLKITIQSQGAEIDDSIQVLSVSVYKSLNKVPAAKIILLDGDMPNGDFPLSNTDTFKPGCEISIKAGYGDDDDTVFEGIIIRHGIKVTSHNQSRLIIDCRDKSMAMTIGRKNANYVESKDSDIMSSIISGYAGLTATIGATDTELNEVVQYYCSDWDFILSRAEINGMVVCCDDGSISINEPQTSADADLKVGYGDDLIEFQADLDARYQFSQVSTSYWEPKDQAVVSESVEPQSLNEQGDLAASELADVLGLSSFNLQTPTLLDKDVLKSWATGQQIKSGLSRIRGRMKFQGSAKAKPDSLIEVEGVGNRFNGSVYVSAVRHEMIQGNWITEVEFGMSPAWFAEKRDLVSPPAAGLLPGVEGLQIGVVKQLDQDPEGHYKVQVTVPILQAETDGVWARLANFYASNSFGAFFIPEIGDEVVLGYLNNDPSHPVILGSLYSSKQVMPYELTAENNTKAIVTRSQLKIEFDDDKKVITILTPGGNTVTLSDDEKSITLQDENNNKVTLSESGIDLDSPKDITINAEGKISLTATDDIAISSQADVSIDALNIEQTAQAALTATGSSSAEFSASGTTTIKGAMVMIN